MAKENASRPQPRSNDSGVRNWPSAERGPKAISAIAQPMPISTTGVRHGASLAEAGAVTVDMAIPQKRPEVRFPASALNRGSGKPAQTKLADDFDFPGAWTHGCPSAGAGETQTDVLYDLLEMRINGWEMPAVGRMFSSPNMLILSI